MVFLRDNGRIAGGALGEAGRISRENVPYLWGGNSERGFDCSGFVQWCYSVGGYPNLPKDRRVWTTASLHLLGDSIPKGYEGPGDLIFPDTGHVGIYIGPNQFVDAPETGKTVGVHDFTRYNGGNYTVRRLVDPYIGGVVGAILNEVPGVQGSIETGVAAVSIADQIFAAIAGPIAWLSDGNNWIRIGMIAGGSALVLFGIVYLENTT